MSPLAVSRHIFKMALSLACRTFSVEVGLAKRVKPIPPAIVAEVTDEPFSTLHSLESPALGIIVDRVDEAGKVKVKAALFGVILIILTSEISVLSKVAVVFA